MSHLRSTLLYNPSYHPTYLVYLDQEIIISRIISDKIWDIIHSNLQHCLYFFSLITRFCKTYQADILNHFHIHFSYDIDEAFVLWYFIGSTKRTPHPPPSDPPNATSIKHQWTTQNFDVVDHTLRAYCTHIWNISDA